MPAPVFAKEMDRYLGAINSMQPWPGQQHAELPGGPEARQEKQRSKDGIPLAEDHVKSLARLGQLIGVPWDVTCAQ